jgi:hypothetical protein
MFIAHDVVNSIVGSEAYSCSERPRGSEAKVDPGESSSITVRSPRFAVQVAVDAVPSNAWT